MERNLCSFQNKTRLTTVIGAGLLVGTSLAVIIPEGIHSLFADAGNFYNNKPSKMIKHVDTGI